MHSAILPESRRTDVTDDGEQMLLTSYHWRKRQDVEILWFEVRGAIIIKSLERISAPNLRSVGGDCYSCSDDEVCFPILQRVGGDFDFQGTVRMQAPSLIEVGGSLMGNQFDMPNLECVGNRLSGFWGEDMYLPKLRQVGGSFDIAGPGRLLAPVLECVNGDIILSYTTTEFRANRLVEVGGALDARFARIFHAAALQYVGDELNTESAPDFYLPDLEDLPQWSMHPDAERRWRLRGAVCALMRSMPIMDI